MISDSCGTGRLVTEVAKLRDILRAQLQQHARLLEMREALRDEYENCDCDVEENRAGRARLESDIRESGRLLRMYRSELEHISALLDLGRP